MSTLVVSAMFTNNTAPVTGLTLSEIVFYLYSRAVSDGTIATVWNGVAATEEVGGGIYTKAYTSADTINYDYFAYAQYTGATVTDSDYAVMSTPTIDDGAGFWGYSTRTLTASAASTTATVSGTTITIVRGDSLSASLSALGNISTRTKLHFTVKRTYTDADTEALVQIEETAGLLYINGAAATTAANGDITVTNATTGAITITLAAAETAKLAVEEDLVYDVQMVTASGVSTLTTASATVSGDVTRATS